MDGGDGRSCGWLSYSKLFGLNNAGRHSFVNQLAKDGVDMKTIAKLLCHSDNGKTIEAHYTDPSTAVMGRVVDGVRK